MPDQTSRIRLGSVLPKRVRNISCKTGPSPIWMAWSGLGQMRLVRCARVIGPGFWQNANDPLPVSHFQTRLRSSAGCPDHNYCAKPAWIWLSVSDLGQTDPDRKHAGVQEPSDWMLIGSGMFSLLSLVQPSTQTIALTYLNFGVT